ncbi:MULTISPECIES: hypothetical protein [unclassified Microbacterium]|uniref:hypothetical protein n=1 Tax=unclassified Microbacterium TaxID=2609290 RepID=UPI00109BB58C|nr:MULTISPECIES: hypothetical protein [unclassified Microbacterium]
MGGLVIETVRPGVQFVPVAAAAFRRANAQVRAEFGRDIDSNSTYRSWSDQMLMFTNWNRYVASGRLPALYPGHSKAVHPSESFHVSGLALDSDDWKIPRIVAILAEHGFIRTRLHVPGEDHHFEYVQKRDRHFGEPIPTGSATAPATTARPESEEDEMPDSMFAIVDGVPSWCWLNWGTGALIAVHTQAEADWIGSYMGSIRQDLRFARVNGAQVTDGGTELYKNKLAMFGLLCPKPTIQRGGLSDGDFTRLEAMITAGVKDALTGVA